ncbi:V-type ATPase 116kDa subunit family protein [Planosporangium sp. 12N6]|uniref:V-type ATPase 116kDa subunit family protein n=1 Tax=Planosporangium spinosum TaxID=3402278 RepID=UPI003CF3E59D
MRWREALAPVPMSRVAVVTPRMSVRATLVRLADAGMMEIERAEASPAGRAGGVPPQLSVTEPDLDLITRTGRADLVAGETELAGYRAEMVERGEVAALVGWVPKADLAGLAGRLAEVGAAAVPLPMPRGVQPPSAAPPGPARRAFAPLVEAYTTVPYRDVDPTLLAGLAYVVMFGAMFGDVGHGALLIGIAVAIRLGRLGWLARARPYWLFIAAAGLASALFGMAYGECFGPTGLVPTLWLAPMDQPVRLLVAAVGFGAVLLAGAYLLGTVNRVREGGWAVALYAPSGLAGGLLFLAAGLATLAWYAHLAWAGFTAGGLALVALALSYAGLLAAAGGGASGVVQASIELFDVVIRIGANVVSFARLAAFGLTHAVLGAIVWRATVALWHRGAAGVAGAVVAFAVGNAVAFGLEALVAAVQALRLEYYELFSRVFELQGRPFRPWHVPTAEPLPAAPVRSEEEPCSPG